MAAPKILVVFDSVDGQVLRVRSNEPNPMVEVLDVDDENEAEELETKNEAEYPYIVWGQEDEDEDSE